MIVIISGKEKRLAGQFPQIRFLKYQFSESKLANNQFAVALIWGQQTDV